MMLSVSGVLAQGPTRVGAEYVGESEPIIINVDLRDLPVTPPWRPGDPIVEFPQKSFEPGVIPSQRQNALDPLLELQENAQQGSDPVFGTTIVNRDGHGFSGVTPPDTVGDVGLNYFIQAVNRSGGTDYTIFDKVDGSIVAGPFVLDALGSGACAFGLGDPIVLYDSIANRWFLSEFNTGVNNACIYISQTDDPVSGGWFAYSFPFPDAIDYPKYGIWPDGYYMTSNDGNSGPNLVAVMDRANMLAGLPATVQTFTVPDLAGFGFQAATPADLDGATLPPAGSPNYLMRHRDDEVHNGGSNDPGQDFLEYFEFSVDWAQPGNSSITGPTSIPIAEIDSEFCGLSLVPCLVQPGGGTLHPVKEVIMNRLQYRNFGAHQTLVGSFITDVDATNHGGVRWFELRKTTGPWSLHQEGTISQDADNRWMSSIAMDGAGNMALAYNVAGTATFPSIRYVGRKANDPLGTMPEGEHVGVDGTASNSSTRYGDYSAMSVDPVDDATFWFTGEYNPSSAWSTRFMSFRFEQNCAAAAPANFAAAASGLKDIGLTWDPVRGTATYRVYRADGSCGGSFSLIASGLTSNSYDDHDVIAGTTYAYVVTSVLSESCESPQSVCREVAAPQCSDLLAEIENWNVFLDVLDLVGCI